MLYNSKSINHKITQIIVADDDPILIFVKNYLSALGCEKKNKIPLLDHCRIAAPGNFVKFSRQAGTFSIHSENQGGFKYYRY